MTTPRFDSRSLLALAALGACLAAPVAHAGVLGGGSASLGGAVGPRSLDVGGQARVGVQRDALPTGKVRATAGAVSGEASRTKDTAAAKGAQAQAEAKATVQATRDGAQARGDAAVNQAAAAKAGTEHNARKLAATPVEAQTGAQTSTSATGTGHDHTTRADASASGDAKVSRVDRSVNASASGNASVSR